jgi:A-factor biosynthesis hotdog domain
MNGGSAARAVFLVGDRFSRFAAHEQIVTVGSFLTAARSGDYDDLSTPLVLRVGQGVDDEDLAQVAAAAERIGRARVILIPHEAGPLPPARHVHKKTPQNVLISEIERVGDDTFHAALRIHNDNELLLDHQSSLHVQGMVAIEAARQMFLAVCERFYSSRWPDRRYTYLLNLVATRFEAPLFPLGATVELITGRAELANPEKLDYSFQIDVLQAGRRTSSTALEAVALPQERVTAREKRLTGRMLPEILSPDRHAALEQVE